MIKISLELKHKQHAEDFNRINAFQIENGVIAKKDGPKVYRLFKLFCLKDRVLNSLIVRERKVVGNVLTEKAADNNKPSAMEVANGWKLPDYTDTQILMDDMGLSLVDFMSRFEKFKVDEISIDDAEDDICFNAKEYFEESPMMSLIGLRFTEDESTIEWEKRKVEYSPAGHLPKDFQELLKSDCGNNCSFLFALHPENINKEILTVIGSAHIFVDKKSLKQKLFSALQKWFYNPEAFKKQAESKTNEPKKARKIEPGFIDKLLEMFKYRQILRALKQYIEQKDGPADMFVRRQVILWIKCLPLIQIT